MNQLQKNESNITKAIGEKKLLHSNTIALFCSKKCPGSIIIKSFDLMQELRNKDITVISGFHTSVEKECLNILLKGSCGIVICPARSIDNMRIPKDWKKNIDAGRMLITSPFPNTVKRSTKETSRQRNDFVANLADNILILHASQNSNTFSLAQSLTKTKKSLITIDDPSNFQLIDLGYKSDNIFIKMQGL